MSRRLIVAISGASGAIYGIRLLEVARQIPGLERHLIISPAARATISQETTWSARDIEAMADEVHADSNIGASIASGSFQALGMIVAPCSVKALSAIANCYSADLIARAADVQLKEGRPVVLLVRETPLHVGHLKAMVRAAENGAIIMPPVPAFYGRPTTIDDIVNHTVGRALARIGLENDLHAVWTGMRNPSTQAG